MYNPDVHNRQSIRLRDFDYGDAGAYFVTVCAWRRECLFGDVVDGDVRLNELGVLVRDEWLRTPEVRPNVVLDEFVVMPNHFHAILWITDPVGARRAVPGFDPAVPGPNPAPQNQGTARRAPTVEKFGRPVAGSLATIVRSFKSAATKRINALRNNAGCPVWQRNYYEHVIRGDRDLHAVRQYIADNPAKWALDTNHPDRI
ncbi:REP element-mobilizing transposase RayT [Geoalkalibacter ferrihydriticus]|uniref:Transposase n=2 Tax=Geoalkalibacter ferrihydriticus TaxID=392333 RepID=A0A0C2DQ14_9BACT|nr:transposase [Geoalkalibacter ferrihydriticus]KIH75474.1 transposase [Geoalkalibacter ferrihydriticus DSM 17813]SDM84503.1 REP element-mobilizing transposase RayT [Geoalkalibacter ferrihydriticus]